MKKAASAGSSEAYLKGDGVSIETDAERVAAAVTRCSTVARLSGGMVGEVATYLPGRRIPGVVIRQSPSGPEVSVHVVGKYGPTMSEISREVGAAVHSVLPEHRVHISIDDLDVVDGGSAVPA